MNHKKLIMLLDSQLENLDELLTVVTFQQESLINNNVSNLDDAISKEEVLFSKLNSQQKLILSEIIAINNEEQLGLKDFKLSALIKALPGDQVKELKQLKAAQSQIVIFIKEINRINFQNSYLIDHSRELIRNIITNAAALSRSPGQVKNIILDRRG